MDTIIDLITIFLILFITASSWKGLQDTAFFDHYVFETDRILIDKQYYRLLSSGFLHLSWMHLLFNMVALYSFGQHIGSALGVSGFLWLYGISLLVGNLLLLFIHRNHGDYSAAGASGAISGVIFACIVLEPEGTIGFPFVPLEIPAWLFGVLYMLFSLYGIKTQAGNVAHEAHVGGGIAGIVTMLIIEPPLLVAHPWLIAALLVPFTAFIVLVIRKPEVLLIEGYWGYTPRSKSISAEPYDEEEQLNKLLDKVSEKGIESLSKKERALLEKLSEK